MVLNNIFTKSGRVWPGVISDKPSEVAFLNKEWRMFKK